MLEVVNALACSVIFGYCFVVAVVLPGGLQMAGHKAVIVGVVIALGIEIAGPFSMEIDAPALHVVVLHVFLAGALVVWRQEAMHFVRCKFVPPQPGATPRRRSTDWADLDGLHAVNDEQMQRVVGGAG